MAGPLLRHPRLTLSSLLKYPRGKGRSMRPEGAESPPLT